jgi:3-hydroxyanthranilate 3,4-dioxygenase
MVVAGPNARKDYHYNETEELFYQLEGSIKVVIQEDGVRKEMELNAAICTASRKTPHSPVRSEVQLVIERKRAGQGLSMDYYGFVIIAIINCTKCILN